MGAAAMLLLVVLLLPERLRPDLNLDSETYDGYAPIWVLDSEP